MNNLVLIKLENEIIHQQSDMDLNFITNAVLHEFPGSNFFIISLENLEFIQYVKGFQKLKVNINAGLNLLYDKYSDFITNEVHNIILNMPFNHQEYNLIIDDLKNSVSKPLVIDKWKYKLNDIELYDCLNIDPTHNEKYLNWLCTVMFNKNILSEDHDKIMKLLEDFDNPQVKALIKKEGYSIDIMDYEDNNDLWQIVNKCYYSKLDDVEASDRKILYQKRKVFEFRNWLVVTPKTHAEAVTIGRNTNWCTSGDSEEGALHFENYTTPNHSDYIKTGRDFADLYIFINKNDESQKFQWSELTGDFLDWSDQEFKVNHYFDEAFVEEYIYAINKVPFKFKQFLGEFFPDKHYNYFILTQPKNELIKFINSGNIEVINILLSNVEDLSYSVKLVLIENGYGLDIFINYEEEDILEEVVKKGYGLDILIKEDSNDILMEIIRQGYGLDILKDSDIGYVGVNANIMLRQIENGELKPYINDYGFLCYK